MFVLKKKEKKDARSMPIGCRKERRPIGGRCAVRRPGPALLICIWARSLPAANQAAPKPRRPSHSFRFSCSLLCSLSATAGAPAVGGASAAGPRRQLPQSQQRRQRGIAFQPHRQRRAHREVTPETRGPPASPEGSTGLPRGVHRPFGSNHRPNPELVFLCNTVYPPSLD